MVALIDGFAEVVIHFLSFYGRFRARFKNWTHLSHIVVLYPNAIVLGQIENHCESNVPSRAALMTNPLMTISPMQDFPLVL